MIGDAGLRKTSRRLSHSLTPPHREAVWKVARRMSAGMQAWSRVETYLLNRPVSSLTVLVCNQTEMNLYRPEALTQGLLRRRPSWQKEFAIECLPTCLSDVSHSRAFEYGGRIKTIRRNQTFSSFRLMAPTLRSSFIPLRMRGFSPKT
jgi:hypothetical protein